MGRSLVIECEEIDGSSGNSPTTRRLDADFIYLVHRYYDPATAEFLSVDLT